MLSFNLDIVLSCQNGHSCSRKRLGHSWCGSFTSWPTQFIPLMTLIGLLVYPGRPLLCVEVSLTHPNVSQLLPQIIINYRRHSTEGLQGSMMLLWAAAGVPLGVYNIVEEFNVALRIQPQILTALSLVTWAQCLYYGKVGFVRPLASLCTWY